MDFYTLTMADRLEHQRAAALDREIELRRSVTDRGITLAPERPVVSVLETLGLWFRRPVAAPRIRLSH
ncbi:hypothetical protein [Microbacterium sp. 2FI]|uniref:hypothetical protein n=1 Tax=Microbacterium sp. 2FI TaxID=2502193 RepID=UPI0010F63A74|nr:hypothetical protein [Microbacterium sp. 2FI]